MRTTKIEWTEKTWNPITGCTKKSAGCLNCYAEKMAIRLKAMGQKKYINGFSLALHEDDLRQPLKWKQSATIFVCSMSDLFHEDVPFDFIDKVIKVIENTKQHKYQILTKRADIMYDYFSTREVPENVWAGVTVENVASINRIEYLKKINAKIRYISCEPLLEDLGDIDLTDIHWVIVGGESGHNARPMKEEWVLNIKDIANKYESSFFFKQWGTWGRDGIKRNKKVNGKQIDGEILQAMPLLV